MAVGLMQVVLAPECLLPSPSRTLRPVFVQKFFFGGTQLLYVYPSGHQDDVIAVPFSMATTMSTWTSATSTSRGYHSYVVFTGFYSSHSIRTIMTLQLRGDISWLDSTFGLFSSLTVRGAPAVIVRGCSSIFGRLYIMYNRLLIMLYTS
jgi:hypothetical protein